MSDEWPKDAPKRRLDYEPILHPEPDARPASRWLVPTTGVVVVFNIFLGYIGTLMMGAGHGDETLMRVSRYMAIGTGVLVLYCIARIVAK